MFNRQPFNRGKFNTPSVQTTSPNGIALMVMQVNAVQAHKIISANGVSSLLISSKSIATQIKYGGSKTGLLMSGHANGTKVYIAKPDIASNVLNTQAKQQLAGESFIDLKGISLKPGDELNINTCEMTVTINGQNAMQYFTGDSSFFNLANGKNDIMYSDTDARRTIVLDILWKDRWL